MTIDSAILAYRKENFAVRAKPADRPQEPGEIYIEVTHNGYQWTGFTLLQSEVSAIIEALQKAKHP